jgi:histidinol-phosphate aminotransferase
VLRTFSKVYGLAGLRIGYALGREDLVKGLNQVRDPFPVHRLAQVAAEAALKDKEHEKMSVQMIRDGRKYLYRELKRLGLSYVPSQANFLLIDFGRDINEVTEGLLREGIIIRPGRMWNYPTSGRVTIARIGDHRKFIKALKKVLNSN